MKINLKTLTKHELIEFLEDMGQKKYRADQLIRWMYRKKALSFNEMSDLGRELRRQLDAAAAISNPEIISSLRSRDGTQKLLFGLDDGESVESIIIPNTKGPGLHTLCISSQVGCAVHCSFCTTGSLGFRRNLVHHEIVDQVLAAQRYIENLETLPSSSITNIVFMGMGEPFHNFDNVQRALITLTDIMSISKRKITLSTAGVIPGLRRLAETGPIVNLAISLNATTNAVRNRIMPINKTYPLEKLLQACRDFPLPRNRRITFEYVLLAGLNDSVEDARRLVLILRGIRAKVNLIPYNRSPAGRNLAPPGEHRLERFQEVLQKAGLTVMVRKSMGADIAAACGQLKAGYA